MGGDAQPMKRNPSDSFRAAAIPSKPVVLSTNAVLSGAKRGVGFPVVIDVATDDESKDDQLWKVVVEPKLDDSKKDEDIAGGDDPAIKLTTTEDDNTQKGLNATDDSVKDTDMGVVSPEGDISAWATKRALTGPADALMSWKSTFGGAGQTKSGVGFAGNVDMIHDKELDEIDLTGGDPTSKNSAWSPVQLGYCVIGGRTTVDQLTKNTAINSSTLLQAESLNKYVPPVWKIGLH